MIHDNEKDRLEFAQWLKDSGIYNQLDSASLMRAMHTVYWTMKDQEKETTDEH